MAWQQYARNGDEWFYAAIALQRERAAPHLLSPCLFAGAHAFELYIKAAVLKSGQSIRDANNRLLHVGQVLWDRASAAQDFPVVVEVRWELLARYCAFDGDPARFDAMARDDQLHLLEHRFLYEALRHVTDLKYLWAGGPTLPGDRPMAYAFMFPDAEMCETLQALRNWLGHANFPLAEQLERLLRSLR